MAISVDAPVMEEFSKLFGSQVEIGKIKAKKKTANPVGTKVFAIFASKQVERT